MGTRGTAKHALYLGLTVTAMHTLSIYALGLLTLFVSQYILPETLFPWLALLSGVTVTVVGSTLFVGRAKKLAAGWGHLDEHEAHTHGDHEHTHAEEPSPQDHGHDDLHTHEHHAHEHSHLPPETEGRVTLRSIIALGIAGGLVPCPSALILMLGAIALGQVAFGLLLVVVFSLGLAVVLTAIGLTFVYAGRTVLTGLFPRRRLPTLVLSVLPLGSSLFILIVGLAMTSQALGQVGPLRP